MICPNHSRKKRLSPAGGSAGCRGRMVVTLNVPVVINLKSMRSPHDPMYALSARLLRSGVRVSPRDLVEALRDRSRSDVVCSACGWSLARLEAACRRKQTGGAR